MATDTAAFTFDGVDVPALLAGPGHRFTVRSIAGRGTLAPEVRTTRRSGAHGERFVEATLPARDVTVGFALVGASILDQRTAERLLAAAVTTTDPAQLAFADQDGHYLGILSAVSLPSERLTWQQGVLTFHCPDPFLYAVPRTVPITGEALAVATNFDVEPVLTLTASSAASGFSVTVDGATLTYTGQVTAGSVVLVDTPRREVRINGALKVLEVTGEFPVLHAASTLTKTLPGTWTATYTPRWI